MNLTLITLIGFVFIAGLSPVLARIPDTYTVKKIEIKSTARYSGEVESAPLLSLSSPSEGKILWIKGEGSSVKRAEELGQIDPVKARIELKGAKNRLRIAHKVLKQKEELFHLGLISRQELLKCRARYEGIKDKVNLLSYQIKASNLISPVDGIILKVLKGAGSTVTSGEDIISILPRKTLYVIAKIPPEKARDTYAATNVDILIPGGGAVIGKVDSLLPGQQGFVNAKIIPEKPLPLDLLDAVVSVEFTLVSKKALVVPSKAIVERGGGYFVFVVSPHGKLERREVKLGISAKDGFVEVLSGLKEGETVLIKGAYEEEYKNIKKYIHKED